MSIIVERVNATDAARPAMYPASEDAFRRPRHRAPLGRAARCRKLLTTVPVILVSAIAMTFNLVAPAEAATTVKRQLKPRVVTPEPHSAPRSGDRVAATGSASMEPVPTTYTVGDGDTVSGVAARFGLSTASVLALNGLGWSSLIFPGQQLRLGESGAATGEAPASVSSEIARHTVQAGDTISGIADASGLTTDVVLKANGLDRNSPIFPGQTIVLPDAGASTPSTPTTPAETTPSAQPPQADASGSSYTIASGDSVSDIAKTAGVSIQAILDANGLGWSSIIYPGQTIVIPTGSAPAVEPAPVPTVDPAQAPVIALSDEMRGNALIIIAVARSLDVSDQGIVIALAAAAQESGLRNVDYGDRDSLGLFQQRPSAGWGTPEQAMDPVRASLAFFGGASNPNPGATLGLLDIPGWESLSVTQAAQAVQISAYPGYYATWENSARAWLAELG
ncbi:muramidase family protein [Luethyella okanaganae]|uniref:LysM peptidoglycan-binding domain-containing protein n=1 Tax=Luethyella okanaganae TaxID=69372 RepID=A0ABW1VD72_9MICO